MKIIVGNAKTEEKIPKETQLFCTLQVTLSLELKT